MSGSTPNGSSALLDQVRRVARLRTQAAQWGQQLAQRKQGWEEANAGLIALAGEARTKLAEEELRLRDMTVAEFNATGDTKPAPGVSIKRMTDVMYDEKDAFEWALQKQICLQLNVKAFNAVAKEGSLPFVKVIETAQAAVARDLAAVLEVAGVSLVAESPAAAPAEEGAAF